MAGQMISSILGRLVLLYGYWSILCRGGISFDLLYWLFKTPLLLFYLQILPTFLSETSSHARFGHSSTTSIHILPAMFENRVFAQHCILLSLPFYIQVLGITILQPSNTILLELFHLLVVRYYHVNTKWRKPPDKSLTFILNSSLISTSIDHLIWFFSIIIAPSIAINIPCSDITSQNMYHILKYIIMTILNCLNLCEYHIHIHSLIDYFIARF